jgi:DNA-binding transcriptional ArsR family regulator
MAAGPHVLDSREELAAIAHPTRLKVLDALRAADSAAGVARRLGEPRQRINHHVKELARAGLLRSAGERRTGNFVEQLFEAVAGTFVISPRLTWLDESRMKALRDQASLEHLVSFGERVQRDAAALLDRAAFDGVEIASAAVEMEVRLADGPARAAFLDDYLELVAGLVEKHATAGGPTYRVGMAIHPDPEEKTAR